MPAPPNIQAAFDDADAVIVSTIAEGLAKAPSMTESASLIYELNVPDVLVNFRFMLDNNGLQKLRHNIEKKAAIQKQVSIITEEWHGNLTVATRDLDSKNGDMYKLQAETMVRSVPRWIDSQVAALLVSTGPAFTANSFDGVPYFSAAHPMDLAGETISPYGNLDSGGAGQYWYLFDDSLLKPIFQNWKTKPRENKLDLESDHAKKAFEVMWNLYCDAGFGMSMWQYGYASNHALDEAHFAAARTAMRLVPTYAKAGAANQLMGVKPKVLVVGSSNELAAEKLINAATINGGDPNPLYKNVRVVVLPMLP